MNGQMLLGQAVKVDWAFKKPPQWLSHYTVIIINY
jgi:hypothetical protein